MVGLVVVGAAAVGCASGGTGKRPGLFLVDVATKMPDGAYEGVEEVHCKAPGTGASAKKACEEKLQAQGLGLDADLVVVGDVSDAGGSVTMKGKAYRRVLPWQSAQRPAGASMPRAHSEPASLASGTCFAIGPEGTLVTAHHVVEGARSVHVTLSSGEQGVAQVARRNEKADLAVLKVRLATPEYLPLGSAADTAVGRPVWTLGYPVVGLLGSEAKFTDGSISSMTGIRGADQVYQVTVPIQPGNSGGPLVTDSGVAIGVITSTAAVRTFFEATGALPQGVNWAVKAELARGLYDEPPARPAVSGREQAIERAKAALCFVEAVQGDGLLLADDDFGKGLVPKSIVAASYEKLRERCSAGDPDACLTVATVIQTECSGVQSDGCGDLRFARTVLGHACSVGRRQACHAVRP